jgi:TonB family protein
MFNHLIESSSHRQEFKRRGSFVLFTAATYLTLFVITGVVSIYAYDAHLENQTSELELLTFVPPPVKEDVQEIRTTIQSSSTATNSSGRSTRTALIDTTSNPNNAPPEPGTVAPIVPPAQTFSEVGLRNSDPIGPGNGGRNAGGGGNGVVVKVSEAPPPAIPVATPPIPRVLRISRVLNGEAIFLPKPIYPLMARQIRVQGTVSVQVMIDETGRVISAKAVSGHPLLVLEAQKAALEARFSPTKISDQPVKVSGVITYNFVMQ